MANIVTNPTADQTIQSDSLLPASGNTTQSLGGSAATWNAVFNTASTSNLNSVLVVDGVNFTSIQAAISALPSGGGTVFLPAGTYTLASAITFPNTGISLVGVGVGATIINTALTSGQLFTINNHDNCRIADLQINQTDVTGGGGAILISGSQQSVVERVIINGKFSAGITLNANVGESTIFCAFREILVQNMKANGTCFVLDSGTSTLNSIGSNIFECCNGAFPTGGIGLHIAGTGGTPVVYANIFNGCEWSSQPGDNTGTCIQIDANAGRGNTFVGCFAENAATGMSVGSGAQDTYFLNGGVSGNTTNISDSGTNTWIQSYISSISSHAAALDASGNLKINGLGLDGAGASTNTINGAAGLALSVSGSTVQQLQAGRCEFKRFDVDLATSVVTGDFAISGGWGSTGAKSGISGKDQAGTITITPGGTGIAANPTVALTFHDGGWANAAPIVTAARADTNAPTTGVWVVSSVSATTVTFTFIGTPSAAKAYVLNWHVIGI